MTVNPDNFIFHSDFWYPTNYRSGYLDVNNELLPKRLVLTDEYEPGDYYTVFKEYKSDAGSAWYPNSDIFYNYAIGETFFGGTDGSTLYAILDAQAVGARFTGRIHWRLYKKPTDLSFMSYGKIERVAKTLTGTVHSQSGSLYSHDIDTGMTGKFYIRGMFRRPGQGWTGINDRSENSNGDWAIAYSASPPSGNSIVQLNITMQGGGSNIDWEYAIQLIPVYEDSPFAFSSTEYPFSFPATFETSITPPATVPANSTVYRYGDSFTIPGDKVSYQAIYRAEHGFSGTAESSIGWIEYPAAPMNNGYTVSAVMGCNVVGRTVTPFVRYQNFTSSTCAVNQVTAKAYIYAYQNNNTT